jgi:type IV secretion system protein VirD4
MYKRMKLMLIASVVILGCFCVLFAIEFPWITLAAFGISAAAAYRRRGRLTSHGTAEVAGAEEISEAGMLTGQGLCVGEIEAKFTPWQGIKGLFDSKLTARDATQRFLGATYYPPRRMVRLTNAISTVILGPPGCGKTQGLVVPFVLECPETMVITDPKGDIFAASRVARERVGRVVILDPARLVTQKSDCYDPIQFIRCGPETIDECREIAAALVIREKEGNDNSGHFLGLAEEAITGFAALGVAIANGENKSLQGVVTVASHPEKWDRAVNMMVNSSDYEGMLARIGGNLSYLVDREKGSVQTTASRFLRVLNSPLVAAVTRSSSFDPSTLATEVMTVYVVVPPDKMVVWAPLIRVWIGGMLRSVIKGGVK